VDDHPDPVPELRRVFEVWKREAMMLVRFMPTRADFTPVWNAVSQLREQIERELEEVTAVKES
jgi:uncharacterized Ntn-hydrolase superfamily protein